MRRLPPGPQTSSPYRRLPYTIGGTYNSGEGHKLFLRSSGLPWVGIGGIRVKLQTEVPRKEEMETRYQVGDFL
ncbi:hypothetical protein NDU88_003343 [Pleurodeles waltl]|uniref:Uncharacterized protein n=1 Tax=Pleurodeles waltl TaxID=8319 RepID=A0AAV7SFF8_PLEWA|nr:hypothetical protein NDU88_003343 [Pleurodeles waltl]